MINPVKKNAYEGCRLNCTFLCANTLRLIFYMQKTHTAAKLTRPEESRAPQFQCSKLREVMKPDTQIYWADSWTLNLYQKQRSKCRVVQERN